nr:MAG TPA: hypothetical protein [Caudoviricetes sp.]
MVAHGIPHHGEGPISTQLKINKGGLSLLNNASLNSGAFYYQRKNYV